MSAFIDTSAFYAIVDSSDAKHQTAASTWRGLVRQGDVLTTSSYVVTEMIALLDSGFGTESVRRFIEDILPVVQVQWVDQPSHDAALAAMLAIPGRRGPSLTDCASLEVMRRLNVESIFAYDQHFANLGFRVLG